ncbi:flagellar biosynthetic protein FliO [Novosphingobium cyanobacteriorum]|uniref:Flagellar biosynthetic protein FliO n=1 Tax=Novosphingobium cyanobacteriorum TaxID=3024215 RepID=A0ABT6CK39_9SPHN|nr:flagellar biosynthetic protein FliO [Novosphingobium cyanobacteriorum]MDF8334289.1 flagellar biosynthetic protein FliO [Novosphingobium cyanobacteriorum]
MLWYLLKLVILLPLIGGLAWASLKFAKRMEGRFGTQQGDRAVKIIETQMLSPTLRLAVLEFHGREILVSASKTGLVRLAEAPARARPAAIESED